MGHRLRRRPLITPLRAPPRLLPLPGRASPGLRLRAIFFCAQASLHGPLIARRWISASRHRQGMAGAFADDSPFIRLARRRPMMVAA